MGSNEHKSAHVAPEGPQLDDWTLIKLLTMFPIGLPDGLPLGGLVLLAAWAGGGVEAGM
jgi:hypothetical protein